MSDGKIDERFEVMLSTLTLEEIIGWSAYFQILNEDQEKEINKSKRRM